MTYSAEFFQAILQDSPQATLVYGPDRCCRWFSPGFARISPVLAASLINRPIEDLLPFIHPGDVEAAREAWEILWQEVDVQPVSVPFLMRLAMKVGGYRLLEISGFNRLKEPSVQGVVLHLTRVTDRKRTEELLLSERERLLVTLRSIGDGVIATDLDGRITLINSVTEQLTGWTQVEAQGRLLPEVFHIVQEETGEICPSPIEEVLATGATVTLQGPTTLVSRDGRVSSIEDSGAPIRDSVGTIIGAILVFRDVTESKKTAAELLKRQKLDSIGVLAGGIAHDFNNILSAILGNASLASRLVAEDHPIQKPLEALRQASQRAASLTRQLLTFSRGGLPRREPTRVQDLIRATVPFFLQGSQSQYRLDVPEHLDAVMADPGQLEQVIQNLVINARQAMDDRGEIVVGASIITMEEGPIPLPPGRYLQLEFADRGPGVPPSLRDKIFEPYFTTKRLGTGLGLSVVWSIVTNHGGWAQVENRPEGGAVFRLWLPSLGYELPDSEPLPHPREGLRRGVVLIMDDEPSLRTTLASMLRHLGFEPIEADSGESALAELANHGRFSLAILDLTVRTGMGALSSCPGSRPGIPGFGSSCPRAIRSIRSWPTTGPSVSMEC